MKVLKKLKDGLTGFFNRLRGLAPTAQDSLKSGGADGPGATRSIASSPWRPVAKTNKEEKKPLKSTIEDNTSGLQGHSTSSGPSSKPSSSSAVLKVPEVPKTQLTTSTAPAAAASPVLNSKVPSTMPPQGATPAVPPERPLLPPAAVPAVSLPPTSTPPVTRPQVTLPPVTPSSQTNATPAAATAKTLAITGEASRSSRTDSESFSQASGQSGERPKQSQLTPSHPKSVSDRHRSRSRRRSRRDSRSRRSGRDDSRSRGRSRRDDSRSRGRRGDSRDRGRDISDRRDYRRYR
eukprot:TRINITY_DN966_c0_g2_i1.p1 TRINITY_DN966_c0_g2~~TRINITY_DN966_c0_g2_i1.p1  ORF type:complete len:292 (+),score=42.19 TRINITY_DN966_c0_g2_i1:86-961(+)